MAEDEEDRDASAEPAADPQRFKQLPERVRVEDTIATKDTRVARDPEGGRDTERDFMFRHLGG